MAQDDWFYMDMSANLLNGIDICTKIYRILPLQRFLDMIVRRRICFTKIARFWEDPYENFLYSIDLTINGTPVSLDRLKETVFGQSWSTQVESDAMWRIYSQCNKGVKIRVAVSNLMNQLWGDGRQTRTSLYLGNVQYLTSADIPYWLDPARIRPALLDDDVNAQTAQYALLKRSEFQHEQEARLLYITDSESGLSRQDFLELPIDPGILIEEVVLDPRLTDPEFQALKNQIQKSGFGGPISKSALYGLPRFGVSI